MINNLLVDNNTDAVTTNVFTVEDLFYMPLKAVIDANTQASLAAIQIIKKYGFENDKSSSNYGKLKMVSFTYEYVGINGQLTSMSISIPFITLIPLPLLEVKYADVEMAVKILAKLDVNVETDGLQQQKSQILTILSPVKNVKYSDVSLEANMNIQLKMAQSELPAGILKLLNFGQEASIGDHFIKIHVVPSILHFTQKKNYQTIDVKFENNKSLPRNLIFTVMVAPQIIGKKASFIKPIQINKGNLIGSSQWDKIQVIPVFEEGMGIFSLTFFAGQHENNGFVTISSDYSTQENIYFNIQ